MNCPPQRAVKVPTVTNGRSLESSFQCRVNTKTSAPSESLARVRFVCRVFVLILYVHGPDISTAYGLAKAKCAVSVPLL